MALSSEQTSISDDSQTTTSSEIVVSDQLAQLARVDGWHELESDPAIFSLLISDFGCKSIEVEEIYDLEMPFRERHPTVYGYIFLFNVIEERRSRRAPVQVTSPSSLSTGDYIRDEDFVRRIFFAYQKVQNSCASHAIISILLNVKNIKLGNILEKLKEHTKGMSPEDKGYAIGNVKEIAQAHNKYATKEARESQETRSQNSNAIRMSQRTPLSAEAFHFVCFLPIDGRLIELDGLKENPIDHGKILPDEDWTVKLQNLIRNRIQFAHQDHDIRYNLMAVIPEKHHQLEIYIKRIERIQEFLHKLLTLYKDDTFLLENAENKHLDMTTSDEAINCVLNWNGLQINKNVDRLNCSNNSETETLSNASEYEFPQDEESYENVETQFFLCRLLNDKLLSQTSTEFATTGSEETKMKRILEYLKNYEFIPESSTREENARREVHRYRALVLRDVEFLNESITRMIVDCRKLALDAQECRKKQIVDVERRVEIYDDFIFKYIGYCVNQGIVFDTEAFCDHIGVPLETPTLNGGDTTLQQDDIKKDIKAEDALKKKNKKKTKEESDDVKEKPIPRILQDIGLKALKIDETLDKARIIPSTMDMEEYKPPPPPPTSPKVEEEPPTTILPEPEIPTIPMDES